MRVWPAAPGEGAGPVAGPGMDLKVIVLNAENLFLLSDFPLEPADLEKPEHEWQRLSSSVYPNKSLFKLRELARLLLKEDPDLLLLCEVGGRESLENFNRLFLHGKYAVALIEGNSDRHIDVGYLVRRELPVRFELATNKDRAINPLGEKFSRDVAELSLFADSSAQPCFLFLLTHLKSRLDPEGLDPGGFTRRKAELATLVEIYLERERRYGGRVPIAVAGDFNGNASGWKTDPEFAPLYDHTNLKEICGHAGMAEADAVTFFMVGRNSTTGRMLDYCFLSPAALRHLELPSVKILPYLTPAGLPTEPPRTMDAKLLLPSDHYPLVFRLENIPLAGV